MREPGYRHAEAAAGRWAQLTLAEQLANVGSEVGRMARWRSRNENLATGAFERALELLDLTLADPRWRDRLREIARARELLCDAAAGGREYGTSLEALDRYFLAFAVAARAQRGRTADAPRSCLSETLPPAARLAPRGPGAV